MHNTHKLEDILKPKTLFSRIALKCLEEEEEEAEEEEEEEGGPVRDKLSPRVISQTLP